MMWGDEKLVSSVLDEFQKTIIDAGEGEKFRVGINHGDSTDANIVGGFRMPYPDHFCIKSIDHRSIKFVTQDNRRWNDSIGGN
mmetsp:Transcript_1985/g.3374  ORF Transcript_1985/g.3374 Transcript_1985/m.3374 type:complete len:83 (-) Transcript_1985:50-298(-)